MVEPAVDRPRENQPGPVDPAAPGATTPAGDPLHELRLRIPVDLHRQLLSLKVLRGKSLAETVSRALDVYFADHARKATQAAENAEA